MPKAKVTGKEVPLPPQDEAKSMPATLLPCPFCGGRKPSLRGSNALKSYWVACMVYTCLTIGPLSPTPAPARG